MSAGRRSLKWLTVLMLALLLMGLVGGCVKQGTSGLTFYEFMDPT